MSEYEKQIMAAVKEMCRTTEISMITGWTKGRFETFSRCCSAPIFVHSLYEGIPHCTDCKQSLGPDDLRNEWISPRKIDETSHAECPWPMEPE